MRRMFPRFSKENFPNILALVESLRKIGERHNATSGQVALAWLLGPKAFLAVTTGMVAMLLWRQFGSATAAAIRRGEETLVRPHGWRRRTEAVAPGGGAVMPVPAGSPPNAGTVPAPAVK